MEHLWCWDQPRATRTHKTHHGPDLGEATTFPLIIYYVTLHGTHIQMAFLSRDSRDSRAEVPKSRLTGLLGLWSPITLRADLESKCGLKQSCSSRGELSNGMSYVVCSQVFRVDSRLLAVGSQNWQTPGSSTPGLSFGHNLRFRCPNEQCEPILDIYASRAFHWYKERHKPLRFDPSNRSLKFRESTGTPSPKAGVALGVWGFTPSRFPTLPGVPDVTLGLPFGPHPCNPFALVASPKLGLRQKKYSTISKYVSSLETTKPKLLGNLFVCCTCTKLLAITRELKYLVPHNISINIIINSVSNLYELEERLITPWETFAQIWQVEGYGQLKIHGNIINVVANFNRTQFI